MTIKEVANHFNITEYTIRYYEKEGMIPDVKRKNNIRNYEEKDLARIGFIVCMRNAGVSIEALKEYLILYEQGDSTLAKRHDILLKEKESLLKKISDMQTALEHLNKKIAVCEQTLAQK